MEPHQSRRRNVIRVAIAYLTAAWLIAQLVTTLGDLVELPEWAGPVLLLVLSIGFIVAIILAWIYELTGEGLKTEAEIDSDASLQRIPARYLDFTIIALLAVALGYFIWESRFRSGVESDAIISSVAVLPFRDLSPEQDQAWFATGMTDELMNALVRLPELSIVGARTVASFDPDAQSLQDFAESVGISHVIEGSVRTFDNRVRVSAQFVRVADGFNVWSEVFDDENTDMFSIQDRISDGVISGLKLQFLAGDRPVPLAVSEADTDFESYKLYLQGRRHLARRTADDLEQAIRFFEASLQQDADRSKTHSALAVTYAIMPYYSGLRSPDDVASRAKYHAEKALESDASNAEAHSTLGVIHMTRERDWASAETAFRRAFELAPSSADIANLFGDFYYAIGDYDSAADMEGMAARLDPLSAVNQLELGLVYSFLGRFDEAIRQAERAIELNDVLRNAWWQLFRSNMLAGNVDVARRVVEKNADRMGPVYESEARIVIAAEAGYLFRAYETGDAILVSPMHFYLPEDWAHLPEVQRALDQPGLRELFALRRSFIEQGTGRRTDRDE